MCALDYNNRFVLLLFTKYYWGEKILKVGLS